MFTISYQIRNSIKNKKKMFNGKNRKKKKILCPQTQFEEDKLSILSLQASSMCLVFYIERNKAQDVTLVIIS